MQPHQDYNHVDFQAGCLYVFHYADRSYATQQTGRLRLGHVQSLADHGTSMHHKD